MAPSDFFWVMLRTDKKLLARGDFDGLVAALQSKNPGVPPLAIRALGKLGRPEAVPYLVPFASENSERAPAAIDALGDLGRAGVGPLLSLLERPNTPWLYLITQNLAKLGRALGDPQVIEVATRREEQARSKEKREFQAGVKEYSRERALEIEGMVTAFVSARKVSTSEAAELLHLVTSNTVLVATPRGRDLMRNVGERLYEAGGSTMLKHARADFARDHMAVAVRTLDRAWEGLEGARKLAKFVEQPDVSVREAVEVLMALYDATPGGEGFLKGTVGADPVRLVGKRLHDAGGMDMMLEAHAAFARHRPQPGVARNLEHVWAGIGSWQG